LLPGGPDLPGRDPKPWIRGVYSDATVMPTDQDAKREILGAIAVQANDFLAELPELDAEARSHRTHLEALEKLAKAPPLQETELPDWALEPFVEKSGRHDRLAHVCLDIRNSHLDELVAVKARFDQLLAGDALAADTRLVLADLVSDVQADSRRLPLVALVVLLLFIAADLRGVRATVAVFGALLLGLGLVLALMGLIPIHTNFFNLVVLPAVLGTSPDAGIHLWHSRRRSSYAATGRAVIVSALTTMAGFAGLLVAEHPGMRSIGELGVCGIGACVGVIFLALYPARGRRAASDAQSR
jgi:predicted exporter